VSSNIIKAFAQHEEELVAVTQLENSTKTSQQKKKKTPTLLLLTRFVDAEVINTEKINNVCLETKWKYNLKRSMHC
jgi:hypothetical protein